MNQHSFDARSFRSKAFTTSLGHLPETARLQKLHE